MIRRKNLVLHAFLIIGIIFASLGVNSIMTVRAQIGDNQPANQVSGSGYGDFHMLSGDVGWVVLNNQLYWTSNGGTTWSLISSSIPAKTTIAAVNFIDNNEGRVLMLYTAGSDPIYSLSITHDGGVTWSTSNLALFSPGDFNAVSNGIYMQWLDTSIGWIVIKRATGINFSLGSFFRTDDGGLTWTQLNIPIGEPVFFITPDIGWTAGGASGDELYQTLDGGINWSAKAFVPPSGSAIQQIAYLLPKFQDPNNGLLPVMFTDGNYVRMDFYSTTNGGQTWSLSYSTPLDGNVDLSVRPPLTLFDANHFFMVVPHSDRIVIKEGSLATIAKYNQDGKSANLARIDMASAEIGLGLYVAGDCTSQTLSAPTPDTQIKSTLYCSQTNQLLKTTDGGETWNPVSIPGIASANPLGSGKMAVINPPSERQNQFPSQNYSFDVSTGQGVDICDIPTASQMQNWWSASPYGAVNLYIGGSLRGCRNALLNSTLVSQLFQQGWRFIPTWVGPQAPCTSFRSRISTNTATAYTQGVTEADAAMASAINLGLAPASGSNTVIYYDLEAYNTADSTCRNAMKSFMDGWDAELAAYANRAGVYGSVCASAISDFASIPHVPDSVWLAWWNYTTYNPNASVYGASCVSDGLWSQHQRIHQYTGSHDETWGGITINVDSNAVDGILAVPYQGAGNQAPVLPSNPKPVDGGILPRGNDMWLYWSTNGTTCNLHIWGGIIDISPSGNCASLYLGQRAPGAYSWQVTANNANGSTIGPVWHFNIQPYAPSNLALGTVTSTQVNLGWTLSADDPANLDGYDVYINNQLAGNLPKGTVSSSISGLACNTNYSFFLRGNRQNVQSTNSNVVSTTTGSCGNVSPTPTTVPGVTLTPTPTTIPGTPGKVSPANHAIGVPTSLTLTWNGGSNVIYYLYCYDTINNNNCDRSWTATYSSSAVISGLEPGITYFWEIVAVKSTGATFLDSGNWWSFSLTDNPPTVTQAASITPTEVSSPTPTQTVNVPTSTPTPTSTIPSGPFTKVNPINNAAGQPTNISISWSGVNGASYYLYCLDTLNNSACDNSWNLSSTTSVTVTGLVPGNTYYWEVVAVKPSEALFANGGQWWNFNVAGSGPTGTPIPPTATQAIPATSTPSVTASMIATSTGTSTPTPTATQILPGASLTPSATATPGSPSSSVYKVSPISGSTGNPGSLSLNWGPVSGVNYYMYCYDKVNNNICDTIWTVTTQVNINISGLTPGATYYWQVLAVTPRGAVFADSGTWWNFSTSP